MPRRYSVKGKTTNELAKLSLGQFNALTEKELRSVVSRMSATANKRLKMLEGLDIESPALKSARESGGKFSTRGKTLNELRSEYMRVRNFLGLKTSTKKGFTRAENELLERLGATRDELTKDVRESMWRVYNEFKDQMQQFVLGSPKQQKYIYDIVKEHKGESLEQMINAVERSLESDYEKKERLEDATDPSQFIHVSR